MFERNDNKLPVAVTPEGEAFKAYLKAVKGLKYDPETADDWQAANQEILDLKLTPSTVHHDEILQNLTVMFKNDEYIWDRLMPRSFTGGKLGGQFWKYDRRDQVNFPDDEVGDKGEVNKIAQNRTKAAYGLTERSLIEEITPATLQNQAEPLNELMDAQIHVLQGREFNRELRVAAIVGAAGSYSGNTTAIAAGDRWDTASGGDPGADVDAARAATWEGMGPGRWVIAVSLDVHNVLKRHPLILDTFKYGGSAPPFATRQMLAEYFEVDEYVVGKSRKDTANRNQSASYSRIWPNVLALVRVSDSPSLRNAAFGLSLEDKPMSQDLLFLLEEGSAGLWRSRASNHDQELVIAPTCGYLLTTPIG